MRDELNVLRQSPGGNEAYSICSGGITASSIDKYECHQSCQDTQGPQSNEPNEEEEPAGEHYFIVNRGRLTFIQSLVEEEYLVVGGT